MTQKINATTADVLVAFQTRPGVDSDSIINAGEATIKGTTTKIKPQGKGYYGLKMEADTTVTASVVTMQLLGTDYMVCYQEKDELETAPDGVFAITNWKMPGSKTKLDGTQRRLQMLGYYGGQVDKKKGKGTEYGVLGFQADNKLRTDGDPGAKTRKKLDDIVEKKNKSGSIYISRRTLVRFDWAPSSKNPKLYHGWPKKRAPMVDDRGFVKVKSAGIDLHGPVVSVERKALFRVKVIREFVAEDATLVASSDDTNLVEIKSRMPLPKAEKFILEMESKDPGRKPKATSVKIKYKRGNTETEIGSLQVIVMPRKYLKVQVHYITVKDSTGSSITPAGTPENSTNKAHTKALAKYRREFGMAKVLARHILRHYGIFLHFLRDASKTVTLSKAGRLSEVGNDLRPEFTTTINAIAASDTSIKKKLNVLVFNQIEDALGECWDACDSSWPNGVVMMKDAEGVLRTAWVMAHEIGHFVTWANCISSTDWVHADDDPNSNNKKTDLWTVAKLMYSWAQHNRPYNLGFRYKRSGGKVTIRNLPSDPTDNEAYNARVWMSKGSRIYCK